MSNAIFQPPVPVNEPIKSYAPGTPERAELQKALKDAVSEQRDIPMYIDGKEVRNGLKLEIRPPHERHKVVGHFYKGGKEDVHLAINAAMKAKQDWARMPWEQRAAIFLKAADLLAGPYRSKMNAATMICQSKNAFQSEIDAACELIDFLKFNVQYASKEIYQNQPISSPGMWNRMEYRPLEGFVFALTPFNFASIAGNLPASAALMGNTVVWKASERQIYSAEVIMEIFMAAGLPAGVINLVYSSGQDCSDVIFSHKDFGGIHFTGSTSVFRTIWKEIGDNIHKYRSYPRIVGETGGKDFIVAHQSADPIAVAVAMARGAFEYQGQKCSAASRAYIPSNIWPTVKEKLAEDLKSFKMGHVEDFSNFINAVIDEKAFDKIANYIDEAKKSTDAEVIIGGGHNKSEGYFIEPTVILAKNPTYVTMCEEIFGPVLSVYVYDPDKFDEMLDIVDQSSPYALTGSIFSQDRYSIVVATEKLTQSAGNFYINDKPTGAVVGQQPFGGARGSGTNDKAGSSWNLIRWVSPRTIKETFVPPHDYRYPFLQ